MIELSMIPTSGLIDRATEVDSASDESPLRQLSVEFEKAFLSEMLRHSGLGQMSEGFNGGAGEARFSGFLIEEYAEKLAQSGQIGLAERIYQDLISKEIA